MNTRAYRHCILFIIASLVLSGAFLIRRAQAATFIVNSVSDEPDANLNDGVCKTANNLCTLRAAIQQANALNGADVINFDLGAGTPAIPLTSELPHITSPIAIDGNTGGTPRVQLVGTNAGSATGLVLDPGSGGSQIKSLIVRNFAAGRGIAIHSNANTVQNCYIGVDAAGTAAQANFSDGIFIDGANNLIGGNLAAARNIISGNGNFGVFINGTSATGNVISGNYIGTDVNGTVDIGNHSSGVFLDGPSNTVGGLSAAERNVISGNNAYGVLIRNANSNVQGNYIGTNAAGTATLGNSQAGIFIDGTFGGSITNNTIGGTSAGARNLISGNGENGIFINGNGATGNNIQGNYIGTNVNGTAKIGNALAGIAIGSNGNTIGGTSAEARNILSGNNREGIYISGTSNVVQGNFIGTDVNGTTALGNGLQGVRIQAGANNTIGAAAGGARNVISGNNDNGVQIDGTTATGNQVQGNFIGVDVNGSAKIGNVLAGVALLAPNNTVGGTGAGMGNIISGNSREGIYISASSNQVQGNFIGTNFTGSASIANGLQGVRIQDTTSNIIGGAVVGARNLISGNSDSGVQIDGSTATGNQIQGNFIGADVNGSTKIGNGSAGVALLAPNNIVGGISIGARNIISGNSREGIYISASGNKVQGNFIGTNSSGTAALGNFLPGIDIDNAPNNLIGGSDADDGVTDGVVMARNIISGSSGNNAVVTPGHGLRIRGAGATGNQVRGNFIGTDVTGTSKVGNFYAGVAIEGAANNVIGGTAAGARNIISGNEFGIDINSGANDNQVQGNFIGTDVTGTAALGNNEHGVSISGGSTNCIVGGTVAGARNLISGNRFSGISIAQPQTSGTIVQGNLIGTDVTGTVDLGNGSDGVTIVGSNTTIGGASAAARNIISGNDEWGIFITASQNNHIQNNYIGTDVAGTNALGNTLGGVIIMNTSNSVVGGAGLSNIIAFNGGMGVGVRIFNGGVSTGNAIRANSIFSNGQLGIDLNEDGVTPNDPGDPDTGPNNLQNFPVITSAISNPAVNTMAVQGTFNSTANSTFTIEFFSSVAADPTGFGEGQIFRGSTTVTTNSSGDTSFNVTLNAAVGSGHVITATATDASNNTSEFSQALPVVVQTYGISGRVTNSAGGAGFGSVTISLTGSQTATAQTDGNGNYAFTVQAGGNYTVTPSKTNFNFNPSSQSFGNLGANATADFVATAAPVGPTILVEEGMPNQAVALDSVTFVRGPFRVFTDYNFSADHHTRLIIFTSNLGLTQPDASILSVQAAGAPLTIENVGTVTNVPGLNASYIVVRLPDGLPTGDLPLTVTLNGVQSSNAPIIQIVQ